MVEWFDISATSGEQGFRTSKRPLNDRPVGVRTEGEQPMAYYAGLDVSLEQTSVCVVDDAGAVPLER